jgi:hypothetical protein
VWFNFQTYIIFSINLGHKWKGVSSWLTVFLCSNIVYILYILYIVVYMSSLYLCHMVMRIKIYIRVDVVEWSRALGVRLSEWCCSVSMVWVQIPSREERKKIWQLKNLILALFGLIFRRICARIRFLSCQIFIRYFLWLYNEFFIILYNILKIAELDCCQIIILSIYVPSTHA